MTCPVNVSLSGGYPDGRTRRSAGGDGGVSATYMCPSAGRRPIHRLGDGAARARREPAKIAKALDVSRASIYRHLAAVLLSFAITSFVLGAAWMSGQWLAPDRAALGSGTETGHASASLLAG